MKTAYNMSNDKKVLEAWAEIYSMEGNDYEAKQLEDASRK